MLRRIVCLQGLMLIAGLAHGDNPETAATPASPAVASPTAQQETNASAIPSPSATTAHESIDDLRKKADAGDADAQQKLGMAYFVGALVPKDDAQAYALALKSADQGNHAAMCNIAYYCFQGIGTKQDSAAGFAWYKKLADLGDPRGEYWLAQCYAHGLGTAKDTAQWLVYERKAAEQDFVAAEVGLGQAYAFGEEGIVKDPALAFPWYGRAAEHGNDEAQLRVGVAYDWGLGVAKDEAKARLWFEKSALQGNSEAKRRFGLKLIKGSGGPVDAKRGFAFLLNAANRDAYAAYCVADCYARGTFVTKDLVMSYAWGLYAAGKLDNPDIKAFNAWAQSTLSKEDIQKSQALVPEITRLTQLQMQDSDLASSFDSGTSVRIPFRDVNGWILVPLKMPDQSSAYLVFDTGASSTMMSSDCVSKLGLRQKFFISANGIGQEPVLGLLTEKADLPFPGMTFHNARVVVMDGPMAKASGMPVVGILGMDVVKGLVVKIDYVGETIELLRPDVFTPPGPDTSNLTMGFTSSGCPIVQAALVSETGAAKGIFAVDTGSTDSVTARKEFLDDFPLFKFTEGGPRTTMGFGGTIATTDAHCSALSLAGIKVPDIEFLVAKVRQGTFANGAGSIGAGVWRRFDVTFDFSNKKMYLAKNANFESPGGKHKVGLDMTIDPNHPGVFTITGVSPGLAGSKSGFKVGDVIVKVDELGDAPLTVDNLYPLMHGSGLVHFTVKRDGALVPVVLDLRNVPVEKKGTQ